MPDEKRMTLSDPPTYEELVALVDEQRKAIVTFHETMTYQAALIEELREALSTGRRWKPKGIPSGTASSHAGLGVRVEAILRMAEQEAKDLREEARRAADAHLALAEEEAARIRAEATADAAQKPEPKPDWMRGTQD